MQEEAESCFGEQGDIWKFDYVIVDSILISLTNKSVDRKRLTGLVIGRNLHLPEDN